MELGEYLCEKLGIRRLLVELLKVKWVPGLTGRFS
jgi:hypothetical protein